MSDISSAIKQICEEKGLSYDAVIGTIESALAAAYRKDFGEKNQNINVTFDPKTGESKVFDVKTVVDDFDEEELAAIEAEEEERLNKEIEEREKGTKREDRKVEKEIEEKNEDEEEKRRFNPKTDIQISDAQKIKKSYKIDDEISTELDVPEEYGRMAAQTAKQVIIQRLREAERDMVYEEFKDKENEVVSGVVQRREGKIVLIDLGKTVGIIPNDEQIYGEEYKPGERIKIYIKEVRQSPRGAEIILSRTSDEILKKVFYLEIPEISNGLIDIKSVAREAGSRSKVGVLAESEDVDPIGSCVGQRGARIQTIITELGGEKVDIIEYDEDPIKFISNALSPAKISRIILNEKDQRAEVKVANDQLSLAIGKGGQNARLAAKLTGWKIDISEDMSDVETKDDDKTEDKEEKKETAKKDEKKEGEKKKTTNKDKEDASTSSAPAEEKTKKDNKDDKKKKEKKVVKKTTKKVEKKDKEEKTEKKTKKTTKKDDNDDKKKGEEKK